MTPDVPDLVLARNVLPGMVVRVSVENADGLSVETFQVAHVSLAPDEKRVRFHSPTTAFPVKVHADQQVAVIA
ncbi:hypothetical protein [Kocuria rhizophila]|uniref:hypothetical protein n=1 Tax=Kocuria rhizophila TaxID=72000 RepID=UPI001EF4D7DE|nr:hypothetical protein [Kocuria rhizophila]MCG7424622.1 hypothetical protein [Kocuria rhizophila]MCT1879879.1 hypothetical protein [Kocuria rhizophila]WSY88704.1 hypothetical protein OH783_01600 [Kocuria rhizophila]WSZ54131.1 hypothetical protein OG926_01600 [Kocuria rhizophila]